MSKWGTFIQEQLDGTLVHVAPCDDRGFILEPHAATRFCVCTPRKDQESLDGTLWIHNDKERGGANA